MICKKCGKENKSTNIRCVFCNNELIDRDSSESKGNVRFHQKFTLISLTIIFVGIFVFSLFMIGKDIYFFVSKYEQKRRYDETFATLVSYTNCSYREGIEVCNAVYEYVVNDTFYKASPDLLVVKEAFKHRETVYYNPSNPSQCIIYSGNDSINIIVGIVSGIILIFVSVFGILFISSLYKTLKESKKVI